MADLKAFTTTYSFPYPLPGDSVQNTYTRIQELAERIETTYTILGINLDTTTKLMQEGDNAGGDLTGTYPNPTITSSAVTTGKIADSAVTTAKINALAVTTAKIDAGAVTEAKIASDAVTADKIAANSVGSSELADNAVDTAAIQNAAVTSAKLAVVALPAGSTATTQAQSDNSTKVATTAYVDAYVAGSVPDGAIGTAELADGAVTNVKVNASAAIAYSKLNLANSIVNADVASGAAIAYSKLALTGSITEADLAFSVATQTELDNHTGASTSVHGISNTANLVYTSDSRLSDSRTPTGAAGGVLSGTYPNPGFANDMATQTELDNHASDTTSVHGIADTSVLATTTDISNHASDTTSIHGISDTANLVYTNDSRLSDSRTPTGAAGGVLSGTYPNPSFASDMATQTELDNHANATTSVHGISNTANLVYTSDSRLSDARTPTSHASTHVPGGSDVLDYTKIVGYGTALPTFNATNHPAGVLWVVNVAGEPYTMYRSDGSAFKQVGGGGSITVSDSAPASPQSGALWYKSSSGKTYIYYNDGDTSQWVEVGAASQLVIPQHGSAHVRGGADIIDGDRLTVDYVPTAYTRNSAASGAGDNTDLTAHLAGIDAGFNPALVTSLPGSPYSGQIIYYQADSTKGIVWKLRYNSSSSSSYKWEFIGGSPLTNEIVTNETSASLNSWFNLTTDGPKLTAPLAGDYIVSWGAIFNTSLATDTAMGIAATFGGTDPSSFDFGVAFLSYANGMQTGKYQAENVSQTAVKTGLSASTEIKLRYRKNQTTGSWSNRFLIVYPIRVG